MKAICMFAVLCLLASPLLATPIVMGDPVNGTANAVYDPVSGDIKLTLPAGTNTWKIGNHSGTTANFITANMLNWTTAGTMKTKATTKLGETTTGEMNAVVSFDLGNVAKAGLPVVSGNVPAIDLTVGWVGGQASASVSAVPEPATMSLLVLGAMGLIARRRKA